MTRQNFDTLLHQLFQRIDPTTGLCGRVELPSLHLQLRHPVPQEQPQTSWANSSSAWAYWATTRPDYGSAMRRTTAAALTRDFPLLPSCSSRSPIAGASQNTWQADYPQASDTLNGKQQGPAKIQSQEKTPAAASFQSSVYQRMLSG